MGVRSKLNGLLNEALEDGGPLSKLFISQMGKWDSGKSSDLLMITQQVSGRDQMNKVHGS